jgi:DNA polymerase-3 subunit epsilon
MKILPIFLLSLLFKKVYMSLFRWALIDIETTGLHVTQDEITEIALIILTELGVECKWHQLIKPKRSIPQAISALTGITPELVEKAPSFEDIAFELLDKLEGCIFVAHNARFDYGFIKNGLKRLGLNYQSPVLCTIKLVKQLHPEFFYSNLAYCAQSLGLTPGLHHRAQSDVETLHQMILQLSRKHSWSIVLEKAKAIYQKSSIPSKLTTDLNQLPESPGVYLFYGDKNELPLYIGKSISIRQRVMSHFSGDYTHAKEFTLTQQVSQVKFFPTAGELSALLLESDLIKKHTPIYNRKLRRKTTLTSFQLNEQNNYLMIVIVKKRVDERLNQEALYGAFQSVAAAKRALLQWVKTHELCPKLCGLEQGSGSCFSYQLKRCRGACIHMESYEAYNLRLLDALKEYRQQTWPFKGAIAIKEHCPINQLTQFSLFYQWRHLASVSSEHLLGVWRQTHSMAPSKSHSIDAYKILVSYLKNKAVHEEIIELY